MASDIWNISNMNEIPNIRVSVPLHFPFWNNCKQSTLHFVTITTPLSTKIGETFCEGLKWMCKLFEKNGQKDSWKPVNFSKSRKHFIIELALGNSYLGNISCTWKLKSV